MSIWTRISEAIAALAAGESLSVVFEKLRTPPELSVGFTIAVIALGAKMAKADGIVTRNEVIAFREVFHIPASEEANAARVFNLARTDVAGFDLYAAKIKGMFGENNLVLRDLLEGLFHIAVADNNFHDSEESFLRHVANIFGVDDIGFAAIRARFVKDAPADPYTVLGVPFGASYDEARKAWRALVRETHPDQMMARGVPEEGIKLAQNRMAAVNQAWEEINRMHK